MSTFDVVHPACPLPTTALPTLIDALRGGYGEAVVACDMPTVPSLDSCRTRFLWSHKDVDLTQHSVVGWSCIVRQVRDAQKFTQALGVKSLDPLFLESGGRR